MKTDRSDGVGEILKALEEIRNLDADQAKTLPPAYYTSEEFFELEKEEIFRKEWICLGRVDEIPLAGDYFTTELIDEPLIVVRGQDRKVRVLSNVCRHRSSVVLEGVGNRKNFVCPYHAWTYANDGQLLRAPYMDKVKGFQVKNCRLPEFASEVWHGFLYVNFWHKGLEPYAARAKAARDASSRNASAHVAVHGLLQKNVRPGLLSSLHVGNPDYARRANGPSKLKRKLDPTSTNCARSTSPTAGPCDGLATPADLAAFELGNSATAAWASQRIQPYYRLRRRRLHDAPHLKGFQVQELHLPACRRLARLYRRALKIRRRCQKPGSRERLE